ncbi:hypothetical protein ACFL5D_04745 [Candidatus Neomarinimicrobiota bacterium]
MHIVQRMVAILFIILFVSSCKNTPTSSEPTGETFPDVNFETVIREVLSKPSGNITDVDLLTITEIDGIYRGISDISGIEKCKNLQYLNLGWNQIIDISALITLTNLSDLGLKSNQINDIYPLIQNNGIDNGDSIGLWENPLSESSINSYIPQLEARGVEVNF